MLEYIEGTVEHLTPTFVIMKAGSLGYRLQISINTHAAISGQKQAKLFTHLYVKHEGQSFSGFDLYGFATEDERLYFTTVLGVSGIGASTARLMMSALKPSEIGRAIALEDVKRFTDVKGIGPKTAKRLILELKDKIPQVEYSLEHNTDSTENLHNTIVSETLSALTLLGFSKQAAQKAIDSVLKTEQIASVEELVKQSLKKL